MTGLSGMCQFKKYIVDSAKSRKRRSGWLNLKVRTPIVITDKSSLRVVFDFDNGQEEYKEVTYDDELEKTKIAKTNPEV